MLPEDSARYNGYFDELSKGIHYLPGMDAEDLSLKGEAGRGIYRYNHTIKDDPLDFCKTLLI